MCRTADHVDFDLSQLDTKKKIKPKLGDKIFMRLKFTPPAAAAGATKSGYALVATEPTGVKNSDVDAGDVGIELTSATLGATPAAAGESTSDDNNGESAGLEQTEEAMTNLITGVKMGGSNTSE